MSLTFGSMSLVGVIRTNPSESVSDCQANSLVPNTAQCSAAVATQRKAEVAVVSGPDGRWHPGIGDPTVGGWFTVVAYVGAALLAYRALRAEQRRTESRTSHGGSLTWFWFLTLTTMVLLGINKQLDLQSWFTEVGRDLAVEQGWYERRRGVQALFVAGIGISGFSTMIALLVTLRGQIWRVLGAFLGLCFLVVFI